ncbi:MAG: serine/threonine-protein kinase [Dehalococcoidia bacterium]|jgi:serine/threonine protein kinase
MTDLNTVVKEFKDFETKVKRLKQVEAELASLNTRGYEAEVKNLQSKLKKPQYVDEVEKELTKLKYKLQPAARAEVPSGNKGPDLGAEISKKYEVMEILGRGGYSVVYKAKRRSDERIVAIKIPHIDTFATVEPGVFIHEAELWARLHHPNIVEVFDYGDRPFPWLCMEYMGKGSLKQRIGHLELKDALDIAIQLCDALYESHHLGVIHRDIKPANVMFNSEDKPKLADWGLGKMMIEGTEETAYEGTPAYSSPEQMKPDEFGGVGWWTDIYQVGALIYQMVTGELPFKGQNPYELALSIAKSEFPKPSEIKPELPKELDKILAQCLAKKKDDRYKDIILLKAALEDLKGKIK